MVRELFLPKSISGYYLFTEKYVGIDIGRTHVSATQIRVHGRNIVIEKSLSEQLESGNGSTLDEKIVHALSELAPHFEKNSTIRTVLPSNQVIVKEMIVPFTHIEKIKMIIAHEVAPLLPFSIQDAVVDCIITKINTEENNAVVLVAAVKKEYVAHHLSLFEQAGINVSVISVDFFELYGLYRMSAEYRSQHGTQVLIDLGSLSTRIAYIQDGNLRYVRSLSKGIISHIKSMSESIGMQPSAIMEQVIRFGFEHTDDNFTRALEHALQQFWSDISLTISSFTAQSEQKIDEIILLGGGAEIKGMCKFIHKMSSIPCKKIDIQEITTQQPHISLSANLSVPYNCTLSTATALPNTVTDDFNLLKDEFIGEKTPLITKQLITALALVTTLFISLFGYHFYQQNILRTELHASQEELSNEIIEKYNIDPAEADNLDDLISLAQRKLSESEKLVFAFSGGHRSSILQYLLELTTRIDKDAIDLHLNHLLITDESILLEGNVRDFEALKILERDLRKSKLFNYTEQQDDPQFSIKIPLTLSRRK